MPIQTVSEVLD